MTFLNKLNNQLELMTGWRLRRIVPRGSIRFIKNLFGDKSLIGVEIGVNMGGHSMNIMDTLNVDKLYAVDNYGEGQEEYEWIATRNLEGYKDRIVMIKEKSCDAVKHIPNELDFVYIDGDHSYEGVKEDIENYYPKLKIGGVLAGHDMENGNSRQEFGVVKAVIEFSVKNNLRLYIEQFDWWLVKGGLDV